MKQTFADTSYWVAFLWLEDQWREAALEAIEKIGDAEIVTTESVLIEVLNYFSEFRSDIKEKSSLPLKRFCGTMKRLFLSIATKIFSKHFSFINRGSIKVIV